jgi:hypothetical protein
MTETEIADMASRYHRANQCHQCSSDVRLIEYSSGCNSLRVVHDADCPKSARRRPTRRN